MVLCSGEVSQPAAGNRFQGCSCRFDKKSILVPTDFSDSSRHAVEWALAFARRFDCKVVLLDVEDRRTLASASQFGGLRQELMRQIQGQFDSLLAGLPTEGVSLEPVVGSSLGDPSEEILQKARDADLIVMPVSGGSGLTQTLLEHLVDKVIQRAPCPVLCVKNPPPAPSR